MLQLVRRVLTFVRNFLLKRTSIEMILRTRYNDVLKIIFIRYSKYDHVDIERKVKGKIYSNVLESSINC